MQSTESFSNSCEQLIKAGLLATLSDKQGYSTLESLERLVHHKYSNYNDKQAFGGAALKGAAKWGGRKLLSAAQGGATFAGIGAMTDSDSDKSFTEKFTDRLKRPSTWAAAAVVPTVSKGLTKGGRKIFSGMAKSSNKILSGVGKAGSGEFSTGLSKHIQSGAQSLSKKLGSKSPGFLQKAAQTGFKGTTGKVTSTLTNPLSAFSIPGIGLAAAGLPSVSSLYDTNSKPFKAVDSVFANFKSSPSQDAHRSSFRARG